MQDFTTLKIDVAENVARLTINHPPINLFDISLMSEMDAAGQYLSEDESVKAVIIQSADPDFFIAHADVSLIQTVASSNPADDPEASFFHAMTERFRLMPKPTIGMINGIARGGGLEFLAALDMRFCSLEGTVFAQPEVVLGITPGGGAIARWPRIIGYARAMELMLSGRDFDGKTAQNYGMVNRALPKAELEEYVDALAKRLASLPPHAIKLIKQTAQVQGTIEDALTAENQAFLKSIRHPTATRAMDKFMKNGGQTRDIEISGAFD